MNNKNANQIAVGPGVSTPSQPTEKTKLKRIQIPQRINTPTPSEAMQEKYAGLHEQLERLSQRVEQDPNDPEARRRLQHVLRQMLEQDAFLDYQYQSDSIYRVKTGAGLEVNVPKERAVMQPYAAMKSSALHSPMRLFRLALLGLLLSGVPTFFITPIIMWQLLFALVDKPLSRAEKIHATTLMFSSFILFSVACVLSVLLILHLIA
ncbi:MAG: hypothetical protein HZB51_10410 [Chloroflexi bacterium]|nr:hypothetical protein [Chloroflexota bacterium]